MATKKNNQKFAEEWATYSIRRKKIFAAAGIIEDSNLSAQAKILFTIINSYAYKKGYCYASNEVLLKKIGLRKTMLKRYLKELKEKHLIETVNTPSENFRRKIYINFEGLKNRYPKDPVKIPPTAKLSVEARRKLERAKL